MSRGGHRRLGVLLILAAVAVPLAVASLAFACGRLATLHVSPGGGPAGTDVSGFGRNYNSDLRSSAVTLRLNRRNGRILWEGRADSRGTIRPAFRIPNVRPGTYLVLATQYTANGTQVPGGPGRVALRIGRRGGEAAAAWAAPRPGDSGGSGSALGDLPAPVIGGVGAFALALLAGGLAALRRPRATSRASDAAA